MAKPLVSERLGCVEVPHRVYANLLHPLLRSKKDQLADEYQKTGYAKVRSNPFLIRSAAFHISFDVYREKYARAISRFERQFPVAFNTSAWSDKYCFLATAEFLMERLAARGRPRKIKLPRKFPLFNKANTYDCGLLCDWFGSESQQLAKAFDKRNGNDYYQNQLRSELRFETV